MSRQISQTSMALPSTGVGGLVGACGEGVDLGTPINGKLITDFQSALKNASGHVGVWLGSNQRS